MPISPTEKNKPIEQPQDAYQKRNQTPQVEEANEDEDLEDEE